MGAHHVLPLCSGDWEDRTMHGNGTNYVTKGDAVMTAISDAAWIEGNVEVVDKYLKNEFENFTIAYRADNSRTHTCTIPRCPAMTSTSAL